MNAAVPGRGLARFGAAALVATAALHSALSWELRGNYWGDSGQVLGQVERIAHGEALYADVVVTSPPLGYWAIGGAAGLLGTEPAQIALITSALFVVIVAVWWRWAERLMADRLALAVAAPALVLACALAFGQGIALPLGTYAPGGPIGFLCLVGALNVLGNAAEPTWGPWRALAVGVLCGGCVLAKQDFWLPAAYVAASVFCGALSRRRTASALAVAGGSAATVFAGCAAVAASAGWAEIPLVVTGYGVANESGFARAALSLERLVLEGIGVAAIAAGCAVAVAVATPERARALRAFVLAASIGAALVAIHAGVSLGTASRPATPSATPPGAGLPASPADAKASLPQLVAVEGRYLLDELSVRAIPLALPLSLAAHLLWRLRRSAPRPVAGALWWVGLCLMLRVRRGFESMDWMHALVELPVYWTVARALAPRAFRAPARVAIGFAMVGSLVCWWWLGQGPGSRHPAPRRFASERGLVRWPAGQVESYLWIRDQIDARDPARERPVFSFGHNGGIAYWLRRTNPSRCTYGFVFCGRPTGALVAELRAHVPEPFLVYHTGYVHTRVPEPFFPLSRWRMPTRPNSLMARDLAVFEQAARGCEPIAKPSLHGRRALRIYDCAERSPRAPDSGRDSLSWR